MKKIKQAEENEKKEAARNNLSQLKSHFTRSFLAFLFTIPLL
ncbi:hypothetical protein [Pedobacter sp. NJ-S-72]